MASFENCLNSIDKSTQLGLSMTSDNYEQIQAQLLVIRYHLFRKSVIETRAANCKALRYGEDGMYIYWPVNQDLQRPIKPPTRILKLKQSSEEVIDGLIAFYRQIFVGDHVAKVKFLLCFIYAKHYAIPFKYPGYEPPDDVDENCDFDYDYPDKEDDEDEEDDLMAI